MAATEDLIDVGEAAELIGIHKGTLQSKIKRDKSGHLPGVLKVGSVSVIDKNRIKDLAKFFNVREPKEEVKQTEDIQEFMTILQNINRKLGELELRDDSSGDFNELNLLLEAKFDSFKRELGTSSKLQGHINEVKNQCSAIMTQLEKKPKFVVTKDENVNNALNLIMSRLGEIRDVGHDSETRLIRLETKIHSFLDVMSDEDLSSADRRKKILDITLLKERFNSRPNEKRDSKIMEHYNINS